MREGLDVSKRRHLNAQDGANAKLVLPAPLAHAICVPRTTPPWQSSVDASAEWGSGPLSVAPRLDATDRSQSRGRSCRFAAFPRTTAFVAPLLRPSTDLIVEGPGGPDVRHATRASSTCELLGGAASGVTLPFTTCNSGPHERVPDGPWLRPCGNGTGVAVAWRALPSRRRFAYQPNIRSLPDETHDTTSLWRNLKMEMGSNDVFGLDGAVGVGTNPTESPYASGGTAPIRARLSTDRRRECLLVENGASSEQCVADSFGAMDADDSFARRRSMGRAASDRHGGRKDFLLIL